MQFLRLNETCRMIGYSLFSNDDNFVEIGFKRYAGKHIVGQYYLRKHHFHGKVL